VRQSASPCSSSGRVNTTSRMLDCGLGEECLRARVVRAERYSCRADPRDQSADVAHDEYRKQPDARPNTWPETARSASDLSASGPRSNWLRYSSRDFCHLETSLPDQRDHDTRISDESCQAPFNTGHLRFTQTTLTQRFGHALHHCATRQEDA
jgi:hypothetical protein